MHGASGFGFASHWLKNWRESFKPITKRSNRNHVITFDSHLKTALLQSQIQFEFAIASYQVAMEKLACPLWTTPALKCLWKSLLNKMSVFLVE